MAKITKSFQYGNHQVTLEWDNQSEYVPDPSMRYQIYVCMASRELVPDGPARLPT